MGTRVFHLSQGCELGHPRLAPAPCHGEHGHRSRCHRADRRIALVSLLVIATYLAQTSRLRAWEIAVSNQNLQREMDERRRALARLQALKEINVATTSTLDLPTILTVLLEKTSESFR